MSANYTSTSDTPRGVVGFSVSFDRDNLLGRGMGVEHLREMLLRLARTILRNNGNLAYGGNWEDSPDNFTYDLLGLINAEQQSHYTADSKQTAPDIGILYNHMAWPFYLRLTPDAEAKWIKCCRVVRISQEDAGLAPGQRQPDGQAWDQSARFTFAVATCLSAMWRATVEPLSIEIPEADPEVIPPIDARIVLGGKLAGYLGFLPGIFEEALVTLDRQLPLYLIGGLGGATEVLADAILQGAGAARPGEFTIDWHRENSAGFADLLDSIDGLGGLPEGVSHPACAFDALWEKVVAARRDPAAVLGTGLSDEETVELLSTRDMDRVVRLVRAGLVEKMGIEIELIG